MMKKLWKQNFWLLAALGVYALISFYVYRQSGIFIHRAIVWNVFRALLSYLFMTLFFAAYERKSTPGMVIAFLCWLLLFPNVPYLITDFIHISPLTFYIFQESGSIYVRELLPWLELLHLAVGIFFGILSGYRSFYLLHEFTARHIGQLRSWIIAALICLVSSYGVYLGRFLRLNSWDIMHPSSLIEKIIQGSDTFSLQFTLVFFLFLFVTYGLYYFCFHKKIGGTHHEDTICQ